MDTAGPQRHLLRADLEVAAQLGPNIERRRQRRLIAWVANQKQNAVQAFYYANRFHDHLAAAPINFTDQSFEGADRLRLETDDGAMTGPDSSHRNNANMATPPDGMSPIMQMYLWQSSPQRAVNGGDDASILYHEYTHGLSNRLIHDANGFGALNLDQARAMADPHAAGRTRVDQDRAG